MLSFPAQLQRCSWAHIGKIEDLLSRRRHRVSLRTLRLGCVPSHEMEDVTRKEYEYERADDRIEKARWVERLTTIALV